MGPGYGSRGMKHFVGITFINSFYGVKKYVSKYFF